MQSNVIRLLIIISCLASLGAGFFYMSYFRISSIKANVAIPDSYKTELKKQTLPLLSAQSVEKELMRQNPLIAGVTVEKKYPRELILNIKKTSPVAQLKNGASYINLDTQARILSITKKENKKLMSFSFYQTIPEYELKPGRTLGRNEIKYGLRLMSKVNTNGFRLTKLSVTEPSVITLTGRDNEPLILMSTKKDIDKNTVLMHNSIKALTINGDKVRVINLQFSKPFVEYENNSGN